MAEIIDKRRQIFPIKIFAPNINDAGKKDFAETKFDSTLVGDIPNCIQVLEKKEIPPRKYILYSKFFPHGTLDINRIRVRDLDTVTCTNPLAYLDKPVVTIVFINNIQLNQLKFDNNPATPLHIHYVISQALNNSEGIVITFKFMVEEFNADAIKDKDPPDEIEKMIKLLDEYDDTSDEGYTKMGMLTRYTRNDIALAAQQHNMPEPLSPRSPSRPSSPRGGKNSTRRRRTSTRRRRRTSTRRRRRTSTRRRNYIRPKTSTRRRKN